MCLIWKSKTFLNKPIEKIKASFKIVDNFFSNKHVKSFANNEYKPKNVQSLLIIMIVYDLETYIIDRVVPYCSCIYKLCKIFDENNRGTTEKKFQKCLNGCVVFKESDSNNDMLDHVLSFKGKLKKSKLRLLKIIFI